MRVPRSSHGPAPASTSTDAAIAALSALRALGACVLAGVVLGVLVGGVGGRLVMRLLAALNPDASGARSDDGFTIGRFTAWGTLGLLLVTGVLGAVGGAVYCAVRNLRIGPRWFELASLSIGAAVTVGAVIVHTGGIDFIILEPAWLAIALFCAIPGLYAIALTLLAERWLREDSAYARLPTVVAAVPALLILPILPVVVVIVGGWLLLQLLRQLRPGRAVLDHPAAPWVARAGLAAIFVLAAVDLVRDASTLL